MLKAETDGARIRVGRHFSVSFQRTLRLPDDGKAYPLPPGLGQFPIRLVDEFADRVPTSWREAGGFFMPMYQREALWLSFDNSYWCPTAVKVGVGRVNALSGKEWNSKLSPEEEDYLVCPVQSWLDGINSGSGIIRQFVAMPLGKGYTVEGQITGKEEFGGLQLVVFPPKPGRFPEEPPDISRTEGLFFGESGAINEGDQNILYSMAQPMPAEPTEMGLAAGGKMEQKIYPDPHGFDTWDEESAATVYIHIVNSDVYEAITGEAPPPSPITAQDYTAHGLPWFRLYDEHLGDIKASEALGKVKSIKEIDAKSGKQDEADKPVEVPKDQVKILDPNAKKPKTKG